MMGAEVAGRTLGIIGMGRIGSAVARRAAAGFGMRVVWFNRGHREVEPTADWGVPGARRASSVEGCWPSPTSCPCTCQEERRAPTSSEPITWR